MRQVCWRVLRLRPALRPSRVPCDEQDITERLLADMMMYFNNPIGTSILATKLCVGLCTSFFWDYFEKRFGPKICCYTVWITSTPFLACVASLLSGA